MEILRFTLSGNQAFFKKPDVNTYGYFTFGHIHKVALLGIFGAVLGYSGYNSMHKDDEYPEFYEKLKDLHIAILPICNKGSFPKKMIEFNNSTEFANKDGNLIVKQQWIENPKWQIYLAMDCEESKKIADSLLNNKCVYMPYLGSNDHPADISDVCIISGKPQPNPVHIDSLYLKNTVHMDLSDDEEDWFKYEEMLPIALDNVLNMYIYEKMVFSDIKISECTTDTVYAIQDKYLDNKNINIMFF
ncbi:MAG: type I-B CRISPR-associated protein Cas5 [Lachnospiraceae bacterium]|nr:type I-B CRISPR-associated protein Cas5 [Lachnospiraceae bacterium]